MRRTFLLIAVCLFSFCGFSRADEWSKTYQLTGRPDLRVQTSDAMIRVSAWDKNSIEAHVSTSGYRINADNGIRVYEHQSGNAVEIEVRYPHSFVSFGNHHVEIDVQMPRGGRVNLRAGDGRIELNGVKGEMEVSTGDGNQEIRSVEGSLRARAGDGRITASGVFNSLELTTGDGRIDATADQGSLLANDWSLHTGDGSVTLRVPEKLAANVDLHTSDGRITMDLPVSVSGRVREHDIQGTLNGGGKLLTIHTGDGSITLNRL